MRLLYTGAAFCLSLPTAGQGQAVPTSREARPTLERSKIMTQLSTANPPIESRRTTPNDSAIRPFRVQVSDEALADLRRRINATRWPDKETVADRSQGPQLATLQPLLGVAA